MPSVALQGPPSSYTSCGHATARARLQQVYVVKALQELSKPTTASLESREIEVDVVGGLG